MSASRGHDRLNREQAAARSGSEQQRGPQRPGLALQEAAGNQATAALLSGDTPLTPAARASLEQAYGVDLGAVRVHSGPQAAAEARSQGAIAFTREQHVYLGTPDPEVIAHELAHTVQQADVGDAPTLSEGLLEAEAEAGVEVSAGATAPGAVQKQSFLSWLWDDDEKKKEPDPQVKERLLDRLLTYKDDWKQHLDDPVSAQIMQESGELEHAYHDDPEFKKWLKDPTYRPPGATPKQTVREESGEQWRAVKAANEAREKARPKPKGPARKLPEFYSEYQRKADEPVPFIGHVPGAQLGWDIGELAWGEKAGSGRTIDRAKKAKQVGIEAGLTAAQLLTLPEAAPESKAAGALVDEGALLEEGALQEGGELGEEAALAGESEAEKKSLEDVFREAGKPVETVPSGGGGGVAPRSQGGFMARGGASEAEAGGTRVAGEASPTYVPGEEDVPTLRSRVRVFEEGFPQRPVLPSPAASPGPVPTSPVPKVPEGGEQALAWLAGSTAKELAPRIDETPRDFPGAGPARPPVQEPDIPPPLLLPGLDRDEALAPGPTGSDQDVEAPGAPRPEGPVIAAPSKKGSIDKAFAETPGKLDVRKNRPKAEVIRPQTRELDVKGKASKQRIADYEQKATEKLPEVVQDVLDSQKPTPLRKRLDTLKDQFEDLMKEVGGSPSLTPDQRRRAMKILQEARKLARKDFGGLQQSTWRRLRTDPELRAIEGLLRATGDVGPGDRALQVRMSRVKGPARTKFKSMGLEHKVRVADDPWLYNDPHNLIVTDAPQNEQMLEAIRQRGGVWPTSTIEDFVTRHRLSSQKYDFRPGHRPKKRK